MLEHVPAWLGKVLRNVRAGHGKLAVARLGGEDTLHRNGFTLRSALASSPASSRASDEPAGREPRQLRKRHGGPGREQRPGPSL
jgi:hypothetical protein